MIEAYRSQRVNLAKITCDDCGKEEIVSCGYKPTNRGRGKAPDGAQAVTQARRQYGWAMVKGKLRCGACEAKRKASLVTKPERTPSKEEKRQIIALLNDSYDTDAGRYIGGETDDTLAEVLGVLPGWVAEIRDDLFGPAGENEDMAAFGIELKTFLDAATKTEQQAAKQLEALRAQIKSAKRHQNQLARIKSAVGARVRAKAGV